MILCNNCATLNPEGSKFCNECGKALYGPPAPPVVTDYFGGVQLLNDGSYYMSGYCETSLAAALRQMNSPASLSVSSEGQNMFLVQVEDALLADGDIENRIVGRFKVHKMWKLNFDGVWNLGEEVAEFPTNIALSAE